MKKLLTILCFLSLKSNAQTNINKLPTYIGTPPTNSYIILYVENTTYKIPYSSIGNGDQIISYSLNGTKDSTVLVFSSGKRLVVEVPTTTIPVIYPLQPTSTNGIQISQLYLDSLLKK